eukprot:GHVN01056678.1.p1 GENE.GHVN01056678.1~~GHVN01056678.1.p1  ORF type:complete len:280 (+),score=39.12 GHVN01056678.1:79-918(+)
MKFRRIENTDLGRVKLNLIGFQNCTDPNVLNDPKATSPLAANIGACLKSLVQRVVLAPMSLTGLSQRRWSSRKNYDTNILEPGILQLAPSSTLVVDETVLQPGKLNPGGTKSLAALLSLARNGTVPYDFGVYDLPFKTDVCLVVLSVAKSTLKPLLEVVLKTGGSPTQKSNELAGEDLWEARLAIAQAALCQKAIKIPDEVKEFATKSFVEARKSDPLVTSDLFSTWMALARSSTLLDGEESLTVERWEKLMVLDGERRQRLQPLGQKKEPDQLPAAAG